MTLQSSALPYRVGDGDGLEVLLVTSRRKGLWILPKGIIKAGTTPHASAAREAYEEAGVMGMIEDRPVATYQGVKSTPDRGDALILVQVFPLLVRTVAPVWPEMYQRKRQWMPIEEAIDAIGEPSLRRALKVFRKAHLLKHRVATAK